MADVYRDWVLYNVGKAIKNWTEYPFDWTMLNEYNALQQEYTAYQWDIASIQANLRTSIQNKWVSVPANAPFNTYPSYVDQILAVWTFSGVKLNNIRVDNRAVAPSVWWVISFEEGWKLYWCCWTIQESYNSDTAYCALYTFRKVDSWDIAYTYTLDSNSFNWYYWSCRVDNRSAYTNGTNIKFYIFSWYYPTTAPNYLMVREYVWNYKNTNSPTSSYLGWWTSTNPTDYGADLTWYYRTTASSWVASATGNRLDDDAYIYLTLK